MSDRSMTPTYIDLRPLGEAELRVERTFSPEQVMGHIGGTGARPDSGTGTASDDEFGVLGPVTFTGTLARRGDRFQLKGRVTATLQLSCGRCLTPFPCPLNTDVDLKYIPERSPVVAVKEAAKAPAKEAAKEAAKGAGKGPTKAAKAPAVEEDVELQDEDLDTAYYRDHVLDLGDMLREQFYLALPMRPLCRPDCQGLCPTCGIDRNLETCQCKTDWVDPRLSGLKALVTRKTD